MMPGVAGPDQRPCTNVELPRRFMGPPTTSERDLAVVESPVAAVFAPLTVRNR